jgi:hypothetical protein
MLKTIALAGLFVFTSAVSTAATTSNVEKKQSSTQSVPKAPQPKGFCRPIGAIC